MSVREGSDAAAWSPPAAAPTRRAVLLGGMTAGAAGVFAARGGRAGAAETRPASTAALEGLYVRYYTGSFTAKDGNFYLMDVTGGDVTMQLPSVDTMPANAILGFKRVGSAHSVIIRAVPGEHINGRDQISTDQAGWARIILPFAPAGVAAGKGWMSY